MMLPIYRSQALHFVSVALCSIIEAITDDLELRDRCFLVEDCLSEIDSSVEIGDCCQQRDYDDVCDRCFFDVV